MITNSACIVLAPKEVLHRKFIRAALKAVDTHALEALKGRSGQPIHFVTNWFLYALMMRDQEKTDAVVIYSPQARQDLLTAEKHWQREEPPLPAFAPVALDTYDFLT